MAYKIYIQITYISGCCLLLLLLLCVLSCIQKKRTLLIRSVGSVQFSFALDFYLILFWMLLLLFCCFTMRFDWLLNNNIILNIYSRRYSRFGDRSEDAAILSWSSCCVVCVVVVGFLFGALRVVVVVGSSMTRLSHLVVACLFVVVVVGMY